MLDIADFLGPTTYEKIFHQVVHYVDETQRTYNDTLEFISNVNKMYQDDIRDDFS